MRSQLPRDIKIGRACDPEHRGESILPDVKLDNCTPKTAPVLLYRWVCGACGHCNEQYAAPGEADRCGECCEQYEV